MIKIAIIMYTMISNVEALQLIRNNNGNKVFTFQENNAIVFELKNGQYIISPQNGDSSMLFKTVNAYQQFFEKPDFPKTNEVMFTEYEKELVNINHNVVFFHERLEELLNIKVMPLSDLSDFQSFFHSINKSMKDEKIRDEKIIVPIAVVIGDFLCRKYAFHWHVEKLVYKFQVYYHPKLLEKHNIPFSRFWELVVDFYKTESFDFDKFKLRLDHFLEIIKLNFPE